METQRVSETEEQAYAAARAAVARAVAHADALARALGSERYGRMWHEDASGWLSDQEMSRPAHVFARELLQETARRRGGR